MLTLRILALAAALAASEDPASEPFELAAFLREAHSESPAELGQRIAAQGPQMAPLVFQALRDETCPITETGAMVIGPVEEQVLLQATQRLGRASFTALFADGLPADADGDTRRAVLQVLAEVGQRKDVGIAFDLVSVETTPAPRIVSAFEAAVAGMLSRDERVVGELRGRFLDLDDEIACAMARAIAENPSHAGVELLVEMLGFREALDPMLLSQATRAARDLSGPFSEAVRSKARLCLIDPDFQVLRQAAAAVAVLEDFESTELLIGLLEHEREGVRNSAHWALCELTGLRLRADTAGWSSWLETELGWYHEQAPTLRRMLAHGSPVQVSEALRELSLHRYERHRTALEIAQVLRHDNRFLRKQACIVLRQLQSKAPLDSLIESLDDEEGVATAAHETLRVLTGEDLPRDPEAWRKATS
jgi:HEAT repeat protein